MKLAVQDANIFIDLELSGLFDLWLQMGVEVHTTDLIRESGWLIDSSYRNM